MSIEAIQSKLVLKNIDKNYNILSNQALDFIYQLESKFGKRRKKLLE